MNRMAEEEPKISGISSSITGGSPKSSGRSAKRLKKEKESRLLKKTVEAEESQSVSREGLMEENLKCNDGILESGRTKRNKKLLKEAANIEVKNKDTKICTLEESNPKSNDERLKNKKNRRNKGFLKGSYKFEDELERDGESVPEEFNPKSTDGGSDNEINETENAMLEGAYESGKQQEVDIKDLHEEGKPESDSGNSESRRSKKKQRLLEEAATADRCGVCYLSRIPPHMDHVKLRQILSQYGEIHRIYLVPEGRCYFS